MITSSYAGRSVDLFIFQGAKPQGEQRISTGFGTGALTSGIQKIGQTFTILFLTDLGSVATYPNQGTGFITAMRQGRLNDESDIQAEFALAAGLVQAQMRQAQKNTTPPPDEILTKVTLTNVVIDEAASTIKLYVTLTSAAGSNFDVILPTSIPIR